MSDNTERNVEIVRRRIAGEWPTDIAKSMGLSRNTVIGVCWRNELSIAGAQKVAAREKFAKVTLDQAREAKRRYWSGEAARQIIEDMGLPVAEGAVRDIAYGITWRDA